jgi:CRISPR/Cas system-associated exonuclease Cas4 (RecB family)
MKRTAVATMLGLALWCVAHRPSEAQMAMTGVHGGGYDVFETTLVLDVLPLAAEILVDGHVLGSSAALVARAISVAPGTHTIEIRAPGYRRYVNRFSTDSRSSVNRFRVVLVPER